ncbi:unnamed protein product [Mytilus coruscus]|uniref:Uncharacterized protein n=1 Tax=Mytilus coruscus TaxID=42192 RepID=A0A6J8E4M6_MYTCO|nr:unnamed protein product [Mytilus coruscus]
MPFNFGFLKKVNNLTWLPASALFCELLSLPRNRELGEESSIHQQKEDSHHVRAGFKYYYVDHNGQIYTSHVNPSIKIAATQCVSQTAHYKAAQMIGLMVKHMSSSVFSGIATRGHGIGIFCHNEKVTVFPEFYSLRNKASCGSSCSGSCRSTCTADGRKMEDLGGVTNSLSGVREDRIICNNFPGAENILVHEFAHQIYNYMPSSDHNRIENLETNRTFINDQEDHHVRAGFKYYYVGHNGNIYGSHFNPTIKITATQCVSKTAHYKAAKKIGFMVKHMPSDVFSGIATRGHGVGIFCNNEKVSVFPELYSLRNKPGCGSSCAGACQSTCYSDGRKMDDIGGVTSTISAVREDRIMCSKNPQAESILIHEFAHQVYFFMPATDHNRVEYVYNYAKQHGIWTVGTYAMANVNEFWAEATQAFFHVTGRSDVTGGLNMCDYGKYVCRSESEGRAYLQKRDPWLFQVLSKIYTNNQPNTPSGLTACS